MIELTETVIDTSAVLQAVADHRAGAVVLFLGTTREFTQGRQTRSLEYECYPEMARLILADLVAEAHTKWPITKSAVVHRYGHVDLGETSVAVAVSSPHRAAAFAAGQWLIDRLKQVVPIWKKEYWADGTSEWLHPGDQSRSN